MTETAYRRSRFAEPPSYESAVSTLAYEETPPTWIQAAQAYEVSARLDGHRAEIEALIHEARWILDLEDDWDGDEGVGYHNATLERASTLLCAIADCCWDYWGAPLPLPVLNPADEGSIDLSWRGEVRMLINLPSDRELPPTFAALGPDLELYGSVTPRALPTLVDFIRHGT
jgi:hypothetical protein